MLPTHTYPPFPTRRSSDLPPEHDPAAVQIEYPRPPRLVPKPHRPKRQSRNLQARSAETDVLHQGNFRTDRKSTRLNSSHQIISYAVFCLKKKRHRAHRIIV